MRGWEGKKTQNFLLFLSFHGKKKSHFSLWKQLSGHKKMGVIPKILILFKISVEKGDLGRRVGIWELFPHPGMFPVKLLKDFPAKVVLGLGVFFGIGVGRKGGINELGAVAMATCC